MRRREATVAIGSALAAALAGCQNAADASPDGGRADETRTTAGSRTAAAEYDRCPRLVIDVEELPDPAREEVRTALAEGSYETTGRLSLPNVLDPAESYLADGDATYRAVIEESDGVRRLRLREATPSKGAHPLIVENALEEAVAVDVRVVAVDAGETRLEATHTIDAGASVETAAFERTLGAYEASFATERFEDTVSWREEEHNDPLVEPVELKDGDVYYEPQAVAEPVRCEDYWR